MRNLLSAALVLAIGCPVGACQRSDPDTGAIQNAEQIFRTVCARCHGADGTGGVAVGASNAPRNFHDAAFQASRSDDDLKRAIQQGKGAMPGFGNLFSEGELRGLVHKLRSFAPAAPPSAR